jgi:hypothetical protein
MMDKKWETGFAFSPQTYRQTKQIGCKAKRFSLGSR